MKDKYDYFIHILNQTREYYPIIFIYSICMSILTLAIPISVQSLVNTFSLGPYLQPLFVLSIMLVGLLIVLGVLQSLQYLLTEYLQRKMYAKLTANIARALLLRQEKTDFNCLQMANRYFDVILIQKKLTFMVTDTVAVVFQTLVGLVLIGLYHPYFIIFGFIILVSIFMTVYFYLGRCLVSTVNESSAKYKAADFLESISEQPVKPEEIVGKMAEADEVIANFINFRAKHFSLLFQQNVLFIINFALLNGLLLGLGGYLVISNQLSIGQLVAAELVVNAILYHFLNAKKHLETFYDLFAATDKVSSFYKINTKTAEQLGDVVDPTLQRIVNNPEPKFHGNIYAVRAIYSPRNYQKIFRNFSLSVVGLMVVLFLTPWQQTSTGEGKVTALDPDDRTQVITASVSGRVEEWLVRDGQLVQEGDPIVKIIDNDPNFLTRLETERDAAIKKFEAAKVASDTAKLNSTRQSKLMEEGLSARREYEKALITYKKLLAEEAAAAASLAQAEVKLSRQRMQVVTAPREGRILHILHGSGSVLVKEGDAIASFVPSTQQRAVELFIDGNDLPLIYPGRKVRLQFEGWPAVQFTGWPSVAIGSFGGLVTVVDPFVGDNGYFRILIVPDPEDATNWPDQDFLRQGSRAYGLVLLDQVSLGFEIWRKMNGFPKSMERKPSDIVSKKKGK